MNVYSGQWLFLIYFFFNLPMETLILCCFSVHFLISFLIFPLGSGFCEQCVAFVGPSRLKRSAVKHVAPNNVAS